MLQSLFGTEIYEATTAQLVEARRSANTEVAAADHNIAAVGLEDMERHDGARYHLRWILVHMIEEYARHCGHADLLRQAIDGEVGD